jgi:hypothetical protein
MEDLLAFLFPEDLQHPLVAGRLIAFALYGPLCKDFRGALGIPCRRPGFVNPKAASTTNSATRDDAERSSINVQIVPDWQLDAMCMQIEREDIINIYMHKPSDMVSP